ncbi:MAG: hypothetical protein R2731_16635 [Nocardioides sp.]
MSTPLSHPDSAALPHALRGAPFTTSMAADTELDRYDLQELVQIGVLRHPMRGVYVPNDVPDTLLSRVESLRLVIPEGYVVTDRTAGWLWGAQMIMAPGDHLTAPRCRSSDPAGGG